MFKKRILVKERIDFSTNILRCKSESGLYVKFFNLSLPQTAVPSKLNNSFNQVETLTLAKKKTKTEMTTIPFAIYLVNHIHIKFQTKNTILLRHHARKKFCSADASRTSHKNTQRTQAKFLFLRV